MADSETTVVVESETDSEQDGKDWKSEAEKWKAQSRKNEQQAKANAEAARRLAELEEADKSESDKLTKRLTEAEARAAASELRLLKLEVGLEKGLTKDQAQRLTGETREELEADADQLIEMFGVKTADEDEPEGDPLPERTPHEKLRPGRKGADPLPLNGDPIVKALERKLGIRR